MTWGKLFRQHPAALLIMLLLSGAAPVQASSDTLRVATKVRISSLDPAATSARPPLILYHNWGDTLLYRDPESLTLVPCLATSYRVIGSGVVELNLRRGVRFHNGEPFDARAVGFSLERLRSPKSLVASLFEDFQGVEILDSYTVRIRTGLPTSILLEMLAGLFFVYPPQYVAEMGLEEFGRHPVGTGPYRFVAWKDSGEILFKRNPNYFPSPKGKARIPFLHVVTIPEDALRIEALLRDEVDLLRTGTLYPENLPFLEASRGVSLASTDSLRAYFLLMDARGRSGSRLFTDVKVRRAVSHAIDKKAVVSKALGGWAWVAQSLVHPLQFGYTEDLPTYPYHREKARRLLAEAGFPQGTQVDFEAFGSENVAETVAQYLRDAGIMVRMHWKGGRWDELHRQMSEGRLTLGLINWGSYGLFDASAILDRFFLSQDPLCYGTTPQLEALLQEAGTCRDKTKRKALFHKAQTLITQEAFVVPLYYARAFTAMRKGLQFAPSPDGIDRYFLAIWKDSGEKRAGSPQDPGNSRP